MNDKSEPDDVSERDVGDTTLKIVQAPDDTQLFPPLKTIIRVIWDCLAEEQVPRTDTQVATTPDDPASPPFLRPDARTDPSGKRQTLVDPVEARAIVERSRRKRESEQ